MTVQAVAIVGSRLEAIDHRATGWQGDLWCQARALASALERLPSLDLQRPVARSAARARVQGPLLATMPEARTKPVPLQIEILPTVRGGEDAVHQLPVLPYNPETPRMLRDTVVTRDHGTPRPAEPAAPRGWVLVGNKLAPVGTPQARMPSAPAPGWQALLLLGMGPSYGVEIQRIGQPLSIGIAIGRQGNANMARSVRTDQPLESLLRTAGYSYPGDILTGPFVAAQALFPIAETFIIGVGGGLAFSARDALVMAPGEISEGRNYFRARLRTEIGLMPRMSIATAMHGITLQAGIVGRPTFLHVGMGARW